MYRTPESLTSRLEQIDGRGYPAYRDLEGSYAFPLFKLQIDRVQRDPFAPPTLIRVFVDCRETGLDSDIWSSDSRRIAICDYLTRRLVDALSTRSRRSGSGSSGRLEIAIPGQEIVERTSVQLDRERFEIRAYAGLPAQGRRVSGQAACRLLTRDLPEAIREALDLEDLEDHLRRHLETHEDQDVIRYQLKKAGLVAFIADGAILPRRSGEDDRPMSGDAAIPFCSPQTLRVELDTPNKGRVGGMGIRQGVTLITGGGYHGKSTLLKAIERGIYNHVPGDGREYVVTDRDAVKVRAEEGRSVGCVDLSPFVGELPTGLSSDVFSTDDASGSTSQAASVNEVIEMGGSVLLMDEDTSATNFLIRDERMTRLIENRNEPLRPYVLYVRSLATFGVSTILVMGGSGAFFETADAVLRITNYEIKDVTREAKRIAEEVPRSGEECNSFQEWRRSRQIAQWVVGRSTQGIRVRHRGRELQVGEDRIDCSALEQLCIEGQMTSLGHFLKHCADEIGSGTVLKEVVTKAVGKVYDQGLDSLTDRPTGRLVMIRAHEIAGALNRARRIVAEQSR
ncbi:MAG: ATPase [Gemmatimonadetes bacterium]|nr:ATPase [Gemmatimonadota bacterium]